MEAGGPTIEQRPIDHCAVLLEGFESLSGRHAIALGGDRAEGESGEQGRQRQDEAGALRVHDGAGWAETRNGGTVPLGSRS